MFDSCGTGSADPSYGCPVAAESSPRADTGSTLGSPIPTRYRCTACGNLTRFDVVAKRRTRAFHHYSVGGELSVEDEQVLEEKVEEVLCRWCGHGNAIEIIDS